MMKCKNCGHDKGVHTPKCQEQWTSEDGVDDISCLCKKFENRTQK